MKALFEAIKTKINADVPELKHVAMWNGQIDREKTAKTENPYRTPAVFVEFIVDEVRAFARGIKNYNLTVRFHFALQGMKFTRLPDMDFLDAFDLAMTGFRGNSGPYFSSFTEVINDLDEDHDNINSPILDYSTIFRKTSADKMATDTTELDVTLELEALVVPDLEEEENRFLPVTLPFSL